MSTSLLLGVAGAAIGFFTGGAGFIGLGFLAGSLLGSLIDPPKIEGPRLGDLKLQVSSYGKMIPYVWGTGRIAGNCIDQTDLQEHKQKSGGKGGPEVISYTYSASFDLLLCVGPILGIKRIWADGRLIWSDTTGDPFPATLYLGGASQTPDPTFEAIHGVGNVPGYNGFAHVVFSDYFLTDFGNRIPQFEFEIFTNVGTFPWRVSTFEPEPDASGGGHRCQVYASGIVTVGSYHTASLANGHYYERQFNLDGTEVAGTAFDAEVSPSGFPTIPVQGLLAATDGLAWYVRENVATTITANPYGGPNLGTGLAQSQSLLYQNGYIYGTGFNTVSGDIGIARYPASGGVIDASTGLASDAAIVGNTSTSAMSDWVIGKTNRTEVYLYKSTTLTLFEYAEDLQSVIRQWDLTGINGVSPVINGHLFTVYENSQGDLILASDRGIAGNKNAAAFYLNDDLTVTSIGNVGTAMGLFIAAVSQLGNSGYALINDGIISLVPPVASELLSTIVADLSDLTPLAGAYDVSELTDEVRWFAVASQMTTRNAIAILRPLFFFDAVESDDIVKFKKRGATPVFSIPDSSLCGRPYGEDSGDPLRTIRKKEQGLPRTVTLTYYDVEADYQIGAQSSPRQVTLSQNDVSLDVAVGLTGSEALQKCESIQAAEWVERETFEWSTTRGGQVLNLLTGLTIPASMLEPCDVGYVGGREMRILTRNESPAGVIKWTGVLSAPSIYTQSQDATSGGGFTPQDPPGANVNTELVLLDIPILSQHDAPFGFYAAMGPATDGRWPGATLYKSLDGGTTYAALVSAVTPSIIGKTQAAPGSPSVSGVLGAYGGGDVVDESELCVRLTDVDATLFSITATALTNGANLCAISTGLQGSPATMKWELLQFRDATLVAPNTYVLKGFKRGRKSTLTSGHAVGDTFVFLPVTNVDAPESELNQSFKYKAVTSGNALADATAQDFINTGLSALEYYDTEIGHLPPFIGDTGSPGGGQPGIVPAPGVGDCAAGKYLDACGGWSVPAGTGGSPSPIASPLTTKGDLWGYDSGNQRVPIGADFTVLSAYSGVALGLRWVSLLTLLSDFVGDAGSPGGGVRGLVPAPSSGDATADKYLSATGFWRIVQRAPVDAPYYLAGPATGCSQGRVLVPGTGITFTDTGGSPPTQTTVTVSSSVSQKIIQVACSNLTSDLSVGTGKAIFRMPCAMTLTEVRASLSVTDSGSPTTITTVNIKESGTTIFSTKLTIDSGEKTSVTAATPFVLSDTSLADDAEIQIDLDAVGGGARGLVVTMIGT